MSKTSKIMEMSFNGKHYICIQHYDGSANPFKLYQTWYDHGWHRKKVVEYADFDSILFYLLQTKYPVVNWDLR